jgi:crotonobetainyl-CoA:carnitine CoA-transferase CaiB-like acyl-CoA transferase
MVLEFDHPTLGKVKHPGISIKLSDTPGKIRSLAPYSGEHTNAVLHRLGYTDSEIESLRKADTIG